jgi:hypothetical protein
MTNPALRKLLLVLATVLALAAPASQALFGWGLTAEEFSESGDQTLRAAGYAFSIWSLIYAGLIAHAAAQLFDRGRREPIFVALSPAIVAIAGCGGWIIASALDARWATVVIIVLSAAAAWFALNRTKALPQGLGERLLAVWPIALLGGWLLIASAINVLTVMTAEGLIGGDARPAWALGGIGVVAVLAVLAMRSGMSFVFGLPVAWGLVAVFVAERSDQPAIALAGLAAAILVLAAIGWIELKRRAAR